MEIKNNQIKEGIERLAAKLNRLEIDSLPISDYNRYYLKKHKKHIDYNLYLNGAILQEALDLSPLSKVFCDFGGGTGLLGLLAKESFTCTLVYADIYPAACRDIETIAKALQLEVDHVVEGDISSFDKAAIPTIEVLLSRDVIEHVYDLKQFFKDANSYNPKMIHIHNTAANVYNLLRKRYFRKIHHQAEQVGDPSNLKETDNTLPFYQMRYDWISKNYFNVNPEATRTLAILSRGLTYTDMAVFIDEWLGGIKHEDVHVDRYPHNTCDPETGNWAERLLYFDEYEAMAGSAYQLSFKGNLYNLKQSGSLQRMLAKMFNFMIGHQGKTARYIWPSVNLIALPK